MKEIQVFTSGNCTDLQRFVTASKKLYKIVQYITSLYSPLQLLTTLNRIVQPKKIFNNLVQLCRNKTNV